MKNKYALISVYDKRDIIPFSQEIHSLGFTILSSGGTAKVLIDNNIPVTPIEDITGNPESFDGRMKTISFQVESGILFDRGNKKHIQEAKVLNIPQIDIVVCNFYPFDNIVNEETTIDKAIEEIDVGGPTMLRAAAKNFKSIYTVFDPQDYDEVINDLKGKNSSSELRHKLAAKAFGYLSWYDCHIAMYLHNKYSSVNSNYPPFFPLNGKKIQNLRYGDNPHQQAAWYLRPFTNSPLSRLKKLSGRDLSVTNLTDINAGLESVRLFNQPAAVVIKHNTPCGVALGDTPEEALKRAIEADPVSAFGGVIVLNTIIDENTGQAIADFKKNNKSHFDIIAAPDVTETAQKNLISIRKTTGIYTFGEIPQSRKPAEQIRWIDGGYAIQSLNNEEDTDFSGWKVVTKLKPSKKQVEQLKAAWKFISRVKSNSILVVDKEIPMTRGIGSGQTSRIGSAAIALNQAGNQAKGGILASDAFFPFPDTVELAARHGIKAIIQPGGSIRDKDSIEAADKASITMVFVGKRVFWH